jgi:hypothetical protein
MPRLHNELLYFTRFGQDCLNNGGSVEVIQLKWAGGLEPATNGLAKRASRRNRLELVFPCTPTGFVAEKIRKRAGRFG